MIEGFQEKTIYKHDEMHGIFFYIKSSNKTYNGDFKLCVDIVDGKKGDVVLEDQHCYVEHETFNKWSEHGLC